MSVLTRHGFLGLLVGVAAAALAPIIGRPIAPSPTASLPPVQFDPRAFQLPDFSAPPILVDDEVISMRFVRQYDLQTDGFPTRLDVLYGYAILQPARACRVTA